MPDVPSFDADPTLYGPNANGGVVSLNTRQQIDPYWSNWFMQQASNPSGMAAVTPSLANQDQARTQQMQVIQDLQRAAAGDPNSRAQQQLAQGYGAARAQQASLGSTMRGQSAGAAMRGIQQGQAGIQRGFAGDQQMLQLQEQQAAQAMLAQLLAQQQGQDIGQAQMMAQGSLGSSALDDAMRQFYMQGGVTSDIAANQFDQERARAQMGFDLNAQNINNAYLQRFGGMAASAGGAAANMWGRGSTGSGYRQIDGQNSIVPEYDK